MILISLDLLVFMKKLTQLATCKILCANETLRRFGCVQTCIIIHTHAPDPYLKLIKLTSHLM